MSGLAFLDVMACGLGAVMLLFLIVKHNSEAGTDIPDEGMVTAHAETLSSLNDEIQELTGNISSAEKEKTIAEERQSRLEKWQVEQETKQVLLDAMKAQIGEQQARKQSLENEIVAMQPESAADPIEDLQSGEEHYLFGLNVEGPRIAVLLDRSASMTDDLLIDIIERKFKSSQDKADGPKWKRTLRVARWLLARVPKSSVFSVVAFNDKAKALNGGRWANGGSAADVSMMIDEVSQLIPTGATNLEAGLRAVRSLSPAPTDIYVVTDGLPTKADKNTMRLIVGCRGTAKVVSGKCRQKLYRRTITKAALPAGAKVNVILLPLEGDPEAAPEYWALTAATGGTMLVPATGWP